MCQCPISRCIPAYTRREYTDKISCIILRQEKQQTEPAIETMARVKIFSTSSCPFCDKAKQLLTKWSIPYEEAMIDSDQTARREFSVATNGARTVPQIIIDGECIGGFTELTELHMDDKLDHLVEQS